MTTDISELSTTASKPVERRKQPPQGLALFNAFPWIYEGPMTVRQSTSMQGVSPSRRLLRKRSIVAKPTVV